MSWLNRIKKKAYSGVGRETGMGDGSESVGGKLFDGQAQLFDEPDPKRRKNVRKKKQFNPGERPGEP